VPFIETFLENTYKPSMLFKKPVQRCRQYCNLRNRYADNQRGRPDSTRHIFEGEPQAGTKHGKLKNKNMERNDRHDGISLLLALVLHYDIYAPPSNKEKADTGKRTDDKTVGDSPVSLKKRDGNQGQSDEDR
jgi:hypothetical protein